MSKDKFALGKKGVVKPKCDSIFTRAVYSQCKGTNVFFFAIVEF